MASPDRDDSHHRRHRDRHDYHRQHDHRSQSDHQDHRGRREDRSARHHGSESRWPSFFFSSRGGRDRQYHRDHRNDGDHGDRQGRRGHGHLEQVYRAETPPAVYPPGQRDSLCRVAQELQAELPRLLSQISKGGVSAEKAASLHEVVTPTSLPRLDPALCPGLPPAVIRVTREDTLNAAIRLAREAQAAAKAKAARQKAARSLDEAEEKNGTNVSVSLSSATSSPETPAPPLIVNFASRRNPGGGWLNGAMAQEEALFYRSSLYMSLPRRIYPLNRDSVVYSPFVLVVREELAAGHKLLNPDEFTTVSAVSVAALRHPKVRKVQVLKRNQAAIPPQGMLPLRQKTLDSFLLRPKAPAQPLVPASAISASDAPAKVTSTTTSGPDAASALMVPSPSPTQTGFPSEHIVFAERNDRNITKLKMRLVLRAAAAHGHRQLVLGALGCGVFANPPEDVARCWLEVLQETEFRVPSDQPGGGYKHWWQDVVFAVYGGRRQASGGQTETNDLGTIDKGGSSESNYDVFRRILDGQSV